MNSTVSEHDRILGILERIREDAFTEMHEQEAASIYHRQWSRELRGIAARMPYSMDQQVCFRISNDAQRLANENQSAVARRRQFARDLTRRIKRSIAKQNAANGSTSAA